MPKIEFTLNIKKDEGQYEDKIKKQVREILLKEYIKGVDERLLNDPRIEKSKL